jgi:hypothetical protein
MGRCSRAGTASIWGSFYGNPAKIAHEQEYEGGAGNLRSAREDV